MARSEARASRARPAGPRGSVLIGSPWRGQGRHYVRGRGSRGQQIRGTPSFVMMLGPGSYVTPRIRLGELLRMGTVGSLWRAHDEALDREVVVKFMSVSLMDDPIMQARFKREGKFAAQINSPHVVEIYEHGLTDGDLPYIVMELLRGEDLSERLARTGSLSLPEVEILVSQLCAALTETHRVGLIHRDIKPNSIFLVDTDQGLFIKLVDFGLAKTSDLRGSQVTAVGAVVGTLIYMSPEQFFDPKNVDGRTDLWSVSVVAYRALTGQTPFREHRGTMATLASVRDDPITPPSQLVHGIPPEVDAWFDKALGRALATRFQTAQEMAESLHLAVAARAEGAETEAPIPVAPAKPLPAAYEAPPATEPEIAGERARLPADRAEKAMATGGRRAASRPASIGVVVVLLIAGLAAYLSYRAAPRSDPTSPGSTPIPRPAGSG